MISLSKSQKQLLAKLATPHKIQDYLDGIRFNHEEGGETLCSPLVVIKKRQAHCLEGALLAAAALWSHGHEPLLLDLKTVGPPKDFDHVVALFKQGGHWGAISKTNHGVLRYRDPIYKTIRELALSYFHEYFIASGEKTLRSYSRPFNLKKFGNAWIDSAEDLWEIGEALDTSPHIPFATSTALRMLRNASITERKVGEHVEWKKAVKK